jgi:N-acetylmuramoyl-L-alanine amidase
MRRWIIRIVWILIGTAAMAKASYSTLHFSENPVLFDPPIIEQNGHLFVPIRDLIGPFTGTITQSRKDYEYTITLENTTFRIREYTPTYYRNNQPATFVAAPFKANTRLYVPLSDILSDIGYTLIQNDDGLYAAPSSTSIPAPPPEEAAHPSHTNYRLDDATPTPSMTPKALYLPLSRQRLAFKSLRHHNIEYANLNDFLRYLGYTITINAPTIVLEKDGIQYVFTHESTDATIIRHTKTAHTVAHPPRIVNGALYLPFQSFLHDLGFDYVDRGTDRIILRKLHRITISDDDSITLIKNTQIALTDGTPLTSPNRIFWDLPFTACPNRGLDVDHRIVETIVFGQHDTVCRMVMHLKKPADASVTSPTPTTSTISFAPIGDAMPPQKTASLRGKVIIIDPGHGGNDPGAVTKTNDFEKYYTLDISRRLKKEIEALGGKAILIRTNDTNPSLYQRVQKINHLSGDFLVSVHINSFINARAHGTETYYYKATEKQAAQMIQNRLVASLQLKNNGIKKAAMYVLNHTRVPGVLIEPCFITNPHNYAQLKNPHFRDKIATATAAGIADYFKNK